MKKRYILSICLCIFAVFFDFTITTLAYIHDPINFSKYETSPIISILTNIGFIIPTVVILISFCLIMIGYKLIYCDKNKTGKKLFLVMLIAVFCAHFFGGMSWIIGGWF